MNDQAPKIIPWEQIVSVFSMHWTGALVIILKSQLSL